MFKGFFNRMYNGNPNRPDIDPEDMPKNRFELFFTTLGIRIGDLVKLNLIVAVVLIPVIAWTILSAMAFVVGLNPENGTAVLEADFIPYLLNMVSIYLLVLLVALPLAGPPLAGMTYIVRNYARDDHAWLWSDFKEQMKKNWKQSVAAMFVLAVVLYLSFVTLQFYGVSMGTQKGIYLGFMAYYMTNTFDQPSWMWVMQLIFITFVGMFILSYMYVFPLIVTYKMKIGQIFKNSLMLALGRLPFTLIFGFMAVFPFILAVFIIMGFGLDPASPIINYVSIGLVLYYLLFGFTFTSFILNSYTNATFDKLLRADDAPKDPEDKDHLHPGT